MDKTLQKLAEEYNFDPDVLQGFLKFAGDIQDTFIEAIEEAEKMNKIDNFRNKLAEEILATSPYYEKIKTAEFYKTAEGELMSKILGYLDAAKQKADPMLEGMGGKVKDFLGTDFGGLSDLQTGSTLGGVGLGAIGGPLIAKLLGIDPMLGLLLGSLLGGGGGYMYGRPGEQGATPGVELPHETAVNETLNKVTPTQLEVDNSVQQANQMQLPHQQTMSKIQPVPPAPAKPITPPGAPVQSNTAQQINNTMPPNIAQKPVGTGAGTNKLPAPQPLTPGKQVTPAKPGAAFTN